MLAKLEGELTLYQRIVTCWPQFGPALEASVCAALRDTIAATSRQCGLVQVRGLLAAITTMQQSTRQRKDQTPA